MVYFGGGDLVPQGTGLGALGVWSGLGVWVVSEGPLGVGFGPGVRGM